MTGLSLYSNGGNGMRELVQDGDFFLFLDGGFGFGGVGWRG
jgi:hypothetical protein